jgi:hypothetical protein
VTNRVHSKSLTCCNSRCSSSHDQHSRTQLDSCGVTDVYRNPTTNVWSCTKPRKLTPCRVTVVSTDRSGYTFRYDCLTLKMKALLIVRKVCNHLPLDKSNIPGDRTIRLTALPIFRNIGNHLPFDRILDSSVISLPKPKISQVSFQHLN